MPAYCRHPRSATAPQQAVLCAGGSLVQQAPHRRCHSKQHLPDGALPRLCLSPGAPPQRPCQQSSVPAVPLPAAAPHRRCYSKQHLPDGALPRLCPCSATAPQQAVLCADGSRPATTPPRLCLSSGAPPQLCLSPGDPPRHPCQQQTSFGGEKYCGLASNLAHLGRIC